MNRADALSGGQQQRVAIAGPDAAAADIAGGRTDRLARSAERQGGDGCAADINRRDGITVLTNLHTLDTARAYCRRIIGMSAGRIVFDGAPEALTDPVLREIYGQAGAEGAGRAAHVD